MLTNLLQEWKLKSPRLVATIGLLTLLLIALLSFVSARNFQTAAVLRQNTDRNLYEARGFKSAFEKSKNSLSALYLHPQSTSLEDFSAAENEVRAGLRNLHDLQGNNKIQTRRVQKISFLTETKLKDWYQRASDISNGLRANARELQNTLSDSTVAEIEQTLVDFINEEAATLEERVVSAENHLRQIMLLFTIALLCGAGLFLLAIFTWRKEIKNRKAGELYLEAANKKSQEMLKLKSSFLANMSHEIRTPLNGIIGMSKLLEHSPLNDRQMEYVETIKTSSASLLSLINDILDFSKIESGKFQLEETNFELASLLKSTVSIVEYSAKAKNLEIILDVQEEVPEFYTGDPLRIRQILLNLLNNAIKFSDQGPILLRVSKQEYEDHSSAKLLFEVIDRGVGFDHETRAKLFQSFSQGDNSMSRRYGGTGLGLAISKQIVEMMNGTIDAESVAGQGSRFFFSLTLKIAKYDHSIQSISSISSVKPLQAHILVAEDNRINQKVAEEMLGLMGCTCKVVENGQLAIQILQNEDFDLILMDAQMPIMDGYEATRAIRQGQAGTANKAIPILATTANAIKGDIELCLEAGMNDYISKPIAFNDLAFKIEKWIARGRSAIDEITVKKLKAQAGAHSEKFFKELVEIFAEDAPEAVSKMRIHLDSKNFEAIPPIAHTLKSSAAILGALRLKDLAERVERSKTEPITEQQLKLLIDSIDKELIFALEDLMNKVKIKDSTEKKTSPRKSQKPEAGV
ncbi:ATP-binding protein [Bdellovibrio sp. NC01]|uniref:ATP-binding protein n=1 Tax=Bdellovibrio sp. NC01 TaxID=2220073 RepID=UPI00115A2EA2|nr:ATP-binding protein [Bdellovibrio sp. NC01]QDK36859.1 hypothetical protein DOE51_04265 [Bdellovibrio sp. NC01]